MENTDLLTLKEMMEGLLKPLQEKVEALSKENESLRTQARTNMDLAAANAAVPEHLLRPAGVGSGDPRSARHVFVATRPVIDNPEDPLWRHKHISDPGMLVRNTLSGGMKEGNGE